MSAQGFDDDPDEEVLAGPRLPRWTMPVLVATAALVVVGVVTAQLVQGDPTQQAQPSPSSTARTSASVPAVPPVDYFGTLGPGLTPVDVSVLGPVIDVHTDGTNIWELQSGTLFRQSAVDFSTTSVTGLPPGRLRAHARLVADQSSELLWVVVIGVDRPVVEAYRALTLDLVATATWPRPITAAAALGGRLVVADSAGIGAVVPTSRTRARLDTLAPLVATQVLAMVGDPVTGQVVILADRPGGAQLLTVDGDHVDAAGGPEISADAALVVTSAGQLWAGGRGANGPVLTRLDAGGRGHSVPIALLAPLFGEGGTVLAAGAEDLLVGGSDGVVCLRGSDGAPLQRWKAAAVRACLAPRVAYATTADHGLVRLPFDGCAG